MSAVSSERPHKQDIYHIRKREHPLFFCSRLHLSCFQTDCVFSALPTRLSSFPDRKSLQGLSPHHRWPFNTSLATANEPGVAAAWLDPADFAQMFISRSPAVQGWEVRSNLDSVLTLFIYFYLFVTESWHCKFSLGGFFFFFWGIAIAAIPFYFLILAEQTPISHGFRRKSAQ